VRKGDTLTEKEKERDRGKRAYPPKPIEKVSFRSPIYVKEKKKLSPDVEERRDSRDRKGREEHSSTLVRTDTIGAGRLFLYQGRKKIFAQSVSSRRRGKSSL